MTTRDQALAQLLAPSSPIEIAEADVGGVPLRGYARAVPLLWSVDEATAEFGEREFLVYQDECR